MDIQSIIFSSYSLCFGIEVMLLIFLYKKETFPAIQFLKALLYLGLALDVVESLVYSVSHEFIMNNFTVLLVLMTTYGVLLQAILFASFAFMCKTITCEIQYPKAIVSIYHGICLVLAVANLANYNTGLYISPNPDPAIRFNVGILYRLWSLSTYLFAIFAAIVFIRAFFKKENFAHRKSILPGVISVWVMCLSCILQGLFFHNTAYTTSTLVIIFIYFYVETLHSQISTDMITGIGNRQQFHFELVDQMHDASSLHRLFVIMLDINHFKSVNDLYGHNEGDNALEKFSAILNFCCRNADAKPFRYGGDEFVILKKVSIEFQGMANEAVQQFIDRIDKELKDFNAASSLPYDLTASIGYAEYDFDAKEQVPELIARADKMLYQYKKRHHAMMKSLEKK